MGTLGQTRSGPGEAVKELPMNLHTIHHEAHSAAQPQPNGDAEGTAGVAWQPLSRAAL